MVKATMSEREGSLRGEEFRRAPSSRPAFFYYGELELVFFELNGLASIM